MAVNEERFSLHDLITMVRMRLHLFAFSMSVFIVGALVYAHYVPLQYEGEATFQRTKDPTLVQDIRGSESFESRKLTLREDLAGRKAVTELVLDPNLGLMKGFSYDEYGNLTEEGELQKQQLINRLIDSISVRWNVQSSHIDIISLSFQDSDPRLAEEVPNTLVDNYIEHETRKALATLLEMRDEYLGRQLEKSERELAALFNERIEFETQQMEETGILPSNPTALYETLNRTGMDIESLKRQKDKVEQEYNVLNELMNESIGPQGDPNIEVEPSQVHYGPNPEYAQVQSELKTAQQTLDEYLNMRMMTENHPRVVMARQTIGRLEERLAETPPQAVVERVYGGGQNVDMLKLQWLTKKSEFNIISSELERLENLQAAREELANNFSVKRAQYEKILKQIEDKQREYDQWKAQYNKVDMSLKAELENRRTQLEVLLPAQEQFLPSSPSFEKFFGIALLGGIVFGTGMVFLSLRLDQSIFSPEQALRYFKIPVCGYTDVIMTPGRKVLRRFNQLVVVPVVAVILVGAMVISLYSLSLRLNHPLEYEKWQASPMQYVQDKGQQAAEMLKLQIKTGI